jgi:hypothetical protein
MMLRKKWRQVIVNYWKDSDVPLGETRVELVGHDRRGAEKAQSNGISLKADSEVYTAGINLPKGR